MPAGHRLTSLQVTACRFGKTCGPLRLDRAGRKAVRLPDAHCTCRVNSDLQVERRDVGKIEMLLLALVSH